MKEIYRCLKKGGRLFVTFPMCFEQEHTVKRAQIVDGKTKYLMESIYHGNPLSAGEALYFMILAWTLFRCLVMPDFRMPILSRFTQCRMEISA